MHARNQFDALAIKTTGACGLKLEQPLQLGGERSARQVLGADAELREVLEGQINAAHLIIFWNVAQDVRQLKRDAQLFRKVRRVRIVKSKHVQARQANG